MAQLAIDKSAIWLQLPTSLGCEEKLVRRRILPNLRYVHVRVLVARLACVYRKDQISLPRYSTVMTPGKWLKRAADVECIPYISISTPSRQRNGFTQVTIVSSSSLFVFDVVTGCARDNSGQQPEQQYLPRHRPEAARHGRSSSPRAVQDDGSDLGNLRLLLDSFPGVPFLCTELKVRRWCALMGHRGGHTQQPVAPFVPRPRSEVGASSCQPGQLIPLVECTPERSVRHKHAGSIGIARPCRLHHFRPSSRYVLATRTSSTAYSPGC